MRVRWATWNVWAIGPRWVERGERAGALLAELEADVVCLQEVRRDARHDVGVAIADVLGFHLARCSPVSPAWWSGRVGDQIEVDNVVLSRWPISEAVSQVLPHSGADEERRSALHVQIDAPSPMRVVSTQLTSSPLASQMRVAQVRALAAELAQQRRSNEVVLVAGDMNAEPDSDEMRILCGHKTAPPVPGHVLMDLWRFVADGSAGDTWDRSNPHVAASNEPSCRIDYLLAAPLPSGRLPHVVDIDRFGIDAVDGLWPSDHAGVVATLEVA